MPEFNKGDFTQQGVNGHVNANVRLNEKRLVNIDLTSNEEAEGCTIAGTVKDLLNDKVYNIGTAPEGNIEITENGENINVAPYATATVNVSGGGGLPFCTVEFINNSGGMIGVFSPSEKVEYGYTEKNNLVSDSSTITKEYLYYYVSDIETYVVGLTFTLLPEGTPNVARSNLVNCAYDREEGSLTITNPSENSSATFTLTTL